MAERGNVPQSSIFVAVERSPDVFRKMYKIDHLKRFEAMRLAAFFFAVKFYVDPLSFIEFGELSCNFGYYTPVHTDAPPHMHECQDDRGSYGCPPLRAES